MAETSLKYMSDFRVFEKEIQTCIPVHPEILYEEGVTLLTSWRFLVVLPNIFLQLLSR